MLRALFQAMLRGYARSQKTTTRTRLAAHRFTPRFDPLEAREVPAVIAVFAFNTLTVFGDNGDNAITVSRNAAGQILVNGGAVPVLGGTPTVANTTVVSVFGQGGNDTITLDEANGALPRANLFGGAGNDTLTGGSGA
ncbi:MAG: hypothetical protein K2V38_25925, partial [Gemmataceae bacterium]|nr:hypothetical protein [Gemmataceae bacterium]